MAHEKNVTTTFKEKFPNSPFDFAYNRIGTEHETTKHSQHPRHLNPRYMKKFDTISEAETEAQSISKSYDRVELESKYRHNNPGNIKVGTFGGQTWDGQSTYKGAINPSLIFRKYATKAHGLADIINVIDEYDTNSLSEIIKTYAQDDVSGKKYKKYYSDLTNIYKVPDTLDLTNPEQILRLMKGITDIENKPDANDYYKEDDYLSALKLLTGIK